MSTKKNYELKKILEELCNGEKIIKEKLHLNKASYKNGYEKYGVLDKNWVQRYKEYITDYLNGKSNQEFNYDINELIPKPDEKIFCIIERNDNNTYYFPINYVLVTSHFISMIAKYFNYNNKINDRLYDIFIGGECIIRRDKSNKLEHYITLLYDENNDNNVDYVLSFKIKENMKEHLDLILKNNFFYYAQLINYSNEPEKEIKDFKKDILLGYIYRNCDEKRGKFLLNMKDDKTNYPLEIKNNITNKNNADINNTNINPNINEKNKNNINNEIINNKNMNYMNNFNNNNNMNIFNINNNMNFMNNGLHMNYGNNMNIFIANKNNMNNNNMNFMNCNNNFTMNNNINNIK